MAETDEPVSTKESKFFPLILIAQKGRLLSLLIFVRKFDMME